MRLFGIATAALCLSIASPAIGCSVTDEYRVPTNLGLAAAAELIFLGTVESGPADMNFQDASLVVRPIEVLKGALPSPAQVTLPGIIAEQRFAVKSNPAELQQAHPLAYIGGCVRYMFVKGFTVLFFVTPAEKAFDGEVPAKMRGMLVPAGGAFSRWAEDVPSADAAWVRATRIYIAAAALPKEQQRHFLQAKREELRKAPDPHSRLVAADIDRQLAGPNKPWNQLMEEEISKMRERGEDPFEDLLKKGNR